MNFSISGDLLSRDFNRRFRCSSRMYRIISWSFLVSCVGVIKVYNAISKSGIGNLCSRTCCRYGSPWSGCRSPLGRHPNNHPKSYAELLAWHPYAFVALFGYNRFGCAFLLAILNKKSVKRFLEKIWKITWQVLFCVVEYNQCQSRRNQRGRLSLCVRPLFYHALLKVGIKNPRDRLISHRVS